MEKVVLTTNRPKNYVRVAVVGSLSRGGINEHVMKRIGAEFEKTVSTLNWEIKEIGGEKYLTKRKNYGSMNSVFLDIWKVPSYLLDTLDWFLGAHIYRCFRDKDNFNGQEVVLWKAP